METEDWSTNGFKSNLESLLPREIGDDVLICLQIVCQESKKSTRETYQITAYKTFRGN